MRIVMTRERKLIVAIGGAMLFFALAYLISTSIRNALPSQEAIALKQQKLSKYREKVLEKKSLVQKKTTLQSAIKRFEISLLGGKTSALAAVEVQQIVSDIIKGVGGQIRTTRILSAHQEDQNNYTTIPIEISIQVSLKQLVDILYKIHTSEKALRMADIGIRIVGSRTEHQTILSTMTVEGFMKLAES